ncbi:SCO family protein [Taylorella equigenitalis]|uniref:SCO family protein n=1 Tax=Taylorella equigenitalis TaxID=29575 RepID=UPI00237C85B0|nr:SCO family protein [Taylorella equigenitalis]WDU51799.1 SCO family protein [Taylorella equigenitalis]WDU54772.1 SCO family protein [Taylorella equigenitalis]
MIRKILALLLFIFFSYAYGQSVISGKPLEFNLMDYQGPKTQKDFQNRFMLLAFGYTSCPDICPMTLSQINESLDKMPKDVAEKLVPVFVNIDPVNSTPESLRAYVEFFDERFVGLTGSIESVRNLTNQLGATFGYRLDGKKLDNPELGMMYTVYHSTLIYLIGPDGRLLDTYDYQIDPADLALKVSASINPKAYSPVDSTPKTITSISKQIAVKKSGSKTEHVEACALPEGFNESKSNFNLEEIKEVKSSGAKVELLNLWAMWCAPCRKELPLLNEFKASGTSMGVITLNLGDDEEKFFKFLEDQKLKSIDKYAYPKMDLLRKLGGIGLPFNALFVDGKQVAFKNGIIKTTDDLNSYAKCMAK